MEILKGELRDKMRTDVFDKILKYSLCSNPVYVQIRKNFGWWGDDDLFGLKIYNPKWHIGDDLDDTT